MSRDFVSILGVRVDVIDLTAILDEITALTHKSETAVISYINVHAIDLAYKHPWFRDYLNGSEITYCDGYGIKWAASLLKRKRLQRLSPPDWFDDLARVCAERGLTLFLLGTRQNVISRAALLLKEKYPTMKTPDFHHGFFDKSASSVENLAVIEEINRVQPDILVVGFGMPVQERWINENRNGLNVRVIFPVGAFFDYYTGEVRRAPRWVTDHGLEWLARLIIEPRRLWQRYVIGIPVFLWRIFIHELLGYPLLKKNLIRD